MSKPTKYACVKATGTKIQNVRSKAGMVRNLLLYSFESRKKKITQTAKGTRSCHGRILVDSNASRMSETPPVNVSALAPKYAGTASTKNGEMMRAQMKKGTRHNTTRFLAISNFLLRIAAKTTTTNTVPSKTSALSECDKNKAPHRREVVARNVDKENRPGRK